MGKTSFHGLKILRLGIWLELAVLLALVVLPGCSGKSALKLPLIAGNGTEGYSGDGGLATSAGLNWPNSVAVDTYGNVYIADTMNQRIRKVDTFGYINTISGTGTAGYGEGGYSGDGGLAISAKLNEPTGVAVDNFGNIYIADTGNQCVRKVNTSGIITTIVSHGTFEKLYCPTGVAVDVFGNVYFADNCADRIWKYDNRK